MPGARSGLHSARDCGMTVMAALLLLMVAGAGGDGDSSTRTWNRRNSKNRKTEAGGVPLSST